MKRDNNLKYYKSKEKELFLTYMSTELEILMQYTKSYSDMVTEKLAHIRGALELACITHIISLEDFNHYKKFLDRIYYTFVTEQKFDISDIYERRVEQKLGL